MLCIYTAVLYWEGERIQCDSDSDSEEAGINSETTRTK